MARSDRDGRVWLGRWGRFHFQHRNRDVPGRAAFFSDGQYLFYNYSRLDGYTAGPSLADLKVVAPDKVAWQPGGANAGFQNISSYARGINGVMIDVLGFHGQIQLDDFQIRVGTNSDLASWSEGPAPSSITLWGGEGVNNSDRVELTLA